MSKSTMVLRTGGERTARLLGAGSAPQEEDPPGLAIENRSCLDWRR